MGYNTEHGNDHNREQNPGLGYNKELGHNVGHELVTDHHKDHAPNPEAHDHRIQMREAEYRKYHVFRD